MTPPPSKGGGETFGEILGFSPKTLEKFYEVGRTLFEEERLAEAGELFLLLALLNPLVGGYWLNLGVCLHRLERRKEALNAYAYAALMDPENSEARLFSAEIYFSIGQPEQAYLELQVCRELLEKTGGEDELLLELKEAMPS